MKDLGFFRWFCKCGVFGFCGPIIGSTGLKALREFWELARRQGHFSTRCRKGRICSNKT